MLLLAPGICKCWPYFCYKNAFADILGPLGFNIYRALMVDLLHEFELGIFKSVFRHLLHLLHATSGTNLVATLDAWYVCVQCIIFDQMPHGFWNRFCQISSFRKGVICRFPSNVSDARQCAARHFEDVLQVGTIGNNYTLLGLTSGSVCYACVWGVISTWAWQRDSKTTFSTGAVACPCKIATSHGPLPWPTWQSYKATRGSITQFSAIHLYCFQDHGVAVGGCSTAATTGMQPWYIDQYYMQCSTKVIQSRDL